MSIWFPFSYRKLLFILFNLLNYLLKRPFKNSINFTTKNHLCHTKRRTRSVYCTCDITGCFVNVNKIRRAQSFASKITKLKIFTGMWEEGSNWNFGVKWRNGGGINVRLFLWTFENIGPLQYLIHPEPCQIYLN